MDNFSDKTDGIHRVAILFHFLRTAICCRYDSIFLPMLVNNWVNIISLWIRILVLMRFIYRGLRFWFSHSHWKPRALANLKIITSRWVTNGKNLLQAVITRKRYVTFREMCHRVFDKMLINLSFGICKSLLMKLFITMMTFTLFFPLMCRCHAASILDKLICMICLKHGNISLLKLQILLRTASAKFTSASDKAKAYSTFRFVKIVTWRNSQELSSQHPFRVLIMCCFTQSQISRPVMLWFVHIDIVFHFIRNPTKLGRMFSA